MIVANLPDSMQAEWTSRLGVSTLNTSGWSVLFEDDFEQTELSNDWMPWGRWQIEDGAARGTFTETDSYEYSSARIVLTTARLPQWAEVEFETWWAEGVVSEVKLMEKRELSPGYIVGLSGFPHPPANPYRRSRDRSTPGASGPFAPQLDLPSSEF